MDREGRKIISIEGEHGKLRLTPEHKMVVRPSREGSWETRTVEEIWQTPLNQQSWYYPKPFDLPDGIESETIRVDINKDWLPKTNTKRTYIREHNTEDYLELLGWYVSRGSSYSRGAGSYNIYLSLNDEITCQRISDLLSKMQVTHKVQKRRNGNIRGISFSNKLLFHVLTYHGGTKSDNKFIHSEITKFSKRLLQYLFDALCVGSGRMSGEDQNADTETNIKSFESPRYFFKSAKLCQSMLWLSTYLGYTTTSGFIAGNYWVDLHPTIIHTKKLEYQEIPYAGWVVNVEVSKNRTICAGEDGRFLFVSNSVYGGVYELNEDLKSRFRMLPVGYPTKGDETRILKKVVQKTPKDVLTKVLTLAHETRQKSLAYSLSTRDIVQILEDRGHCDIEVALRLASGKFEGEDRKFFKTRVASIFGTTI